MKKSLLLLIVWSILAITAGAQTLNLQTINRPVQREKPTETRRTRTLASGIKLREVPLPEFCINSDRTSTMKAQEAETGDNQEWILLGTAEYNEIFKIILLNNPHIFGNIELMPITVYFKTVSEIEWELKLSGFLNGDMYATTNFAKGTTTFGLQPTGIKSPFYNQADPESFEYFHISEIFNWTPFTGGELEFPFYLYDTGNSAVPLTEYGLALSFDFGEFEHFGSATISDNFVQTLNAYKFDVTAGPYEVGYRLLSDNIWLYQIKGFFGEDVSLISYNDAHHSVIPYVNTAYPSEYFGEEGFYEFYRIYSYFVGSPRDGDMLFVPWLNIASGYGYDFKDANATLTFTSDLISTFVMNNDDILAGPDQTSVAIPVEHSSNVTHSKVTVTYQSLDVEKPAYATETLLDDEVGIAPDNTITVNLSKGRGVYFVTALGIDETGIFGRARSRLIYANTSDGRQWNPIGKGLFKPDLYRYYWPGQTAPWLETEIEKADGPESVYRMVNPFRRSEISDNNDYEFIDGMDFYIYFGEDADYSVLQATGLKSGDRMQYLSIAACYPKKNGSHGANGRYDLSIGSITLPGAENYDIVFHSTTSATVTPQVKSLAYSVIPAAEGIRLNGGLDAAYWFDAKVADIITLTPDADGKVTFDRSKGNGEINLLVAATYGQTDERKLFKSSLSNDENGWYQVGSKADMMAYGIIGRISDLEQCEAEVRVNPFNRKIVQLVNPLKPLEGHILPQYGPDAESGRGYYTDFTGDRLVYLSTTPNEQYDYVYSSDVLGNVVESGAFTGLKAYDTDDFYDDDYEYMLECRLECSTNLLYRSGFTDEKISDYFTSFNPFDYSAYPYRCGSAIVFPKNSSVISSMAFGTSDMFNSQYVIYAPTDFDRDYTLKANTDATITCGADISKVKIYCVDIDQEPMSIKDVISSADIPTVIPDGNNSVRIAEETGRYNYIAVGYDNNPDKARPANVIFGTSDVVSGISDIEIDNSNAPVEYYNLQGIRIDNPASGTIVIRRQGSAASKVLIP